MFGAGSGFTRAELRILKRLDRPGRIQDFLNRLHCNFEREGDTCNSPRIVLKNRMAHCVEAALFAAAALRLHGRRPLVVELVATANDDSHMIAVFRERGYWGAIGKTNHAVLRYREPVYRDVRELAISYFHEYFVNETGEKTLRSYTRPIDLRVFDKRGWMTATETIDYIPEHIERLKHCNLLEPWQIRALRKADHVEIEAGRILVEREPRSKARIRLPRNR